MRANRERQSSSLLVVVLLILASQVVGCGLLARREAPVYLVVKAGTSPDRAKALGKDLGLGGAAVEAKGFINKRGLVLFADMDRLRSVPAKSLGDGKPDEKGNATRLIALDFDALKTVKAYSEQRARERFVHALRKAGLHPDKAKVRTRRNRFKAFDAKGKKVADVPLDTRVTVVPVLDGIPVDGPGAKISATFDPRGQVSRLRYAFAELKRGDVVKLISPDEARKRYTAALERAMPRKRMTWLSVSHKLIYFVPPLDKIDAKVVIPHYECWGAASVHGRRIRFLNVLIPAVDDPKYVPLAGLKATAEAGTVTANLTIRGGRAPYKIRWSSSSTVVPQTGKSVKYRPAARKGIQSETVTAAITDANGVAVTASAVLDLRMPVYSLALPPKPREFGTENAVYNQFGDIEQGFIDVMAADGVTKRFSWRGLAAWEQDFKHPEDPKWIDNTDITLYVGHGYGGGFTFEDTTHDDDRLDHDDADDDWGNTDLEWLALWSCQVLVDEWDGKNRFDRWSQEFAGLHLLLGFHTNAWAYADFSEAFAQNLVGASPMKVADAWFDAIENHQSDETVGVVMGVFRKDWVTNWDDHFWGKGSVGPDIRGSDIYGFWTFTGP